MPDRSPRSPHGPGPGPGPRPGQGLGRDAAAALGAHLQRAGESLRAGQLEDAQAEVDAALRLAPDDVRAQNLLGLLHFRTSRLDEARAIYQRLLVLHPGDVALRLNLGLVELRRADYPAAINHLGRVAEVEPDNVRALGYYGLALFRAGELTRALPVLQRAGQADLVRQIEDRLRRAAPVPASSPGSDSDGDDEMTPVRLIASEDETPTPAPPRVAEPLPPSADSPTEVGTRTPLSLGAFLRARALGQRPSPSPFELTREGLLVVRVEAAASLEGAVRLCTLGTLASSGTLRFQALPRTDGALPTDRSFGDGDDALQLALGSGVIVLGPGAGRFTLLSLRGEALRLRQAHLFGFSASLRYECSVLPLAPPSGDGAGQPPPAPEERALITLRGEGELAVRSLSTPAALRVLPGQRCFVELTRLVGWTGALRPLAHPPLVPSSAPYVECRGNGYVLLDPGPAAPGASEPGPG